MIEGSEENDLKSALEVYQGLKRLLEPKYPVGIIHGRLEASEKDTVMHAFRTRSLAVLVGTTVIEVGIHAPGATVMIIEHPERFGLAQLHQMRGRVGRGTQRGICFFMVDDQAPEDTLRRLWLLAATHDGFEIAEQDLLWRGQGQLTGTRQSGAGELNLADVARAPELLAAAKGETARLLREDPRLERPEHAALRDLLGSVTPLPA